MLNEKIVLISQRKPNIIIDMEEKLFEKFPPVSDEQWKEAVLKDLKGADFDKKLVWKTVEGIDVRPYYRESDIKNLKHLETKPGEFPFIRSARKDSNWDICVTVSVDDVKLANKKALKLIESGATFLGFNIRRDITTQDFEQLLEKINLDEIGINFYSGNRNGWFTSLFSYYVEKEGFNPKKVYGSDDFDSLGHMLKHGEFPCKHDDCFCAQNLVDMLKIKMPNFKLISVNARNIHSAGGSVVQELGYGLAMGAQYLENLEKCSLSVDDMARAMRFVFAVGSNYFFEVAKLRAARLLWAKIVEAHNPECDDSTKMYIHCETSRWNKTIYDPHVNILRATTEAMSAILGGTDSLTIVPFDRFYKRTDEFSERVARNIQLILKEEAHFDKVIDPAAGSYYIESLTDAMAEKAWDVFMNVQENGGFLEAFKKGIIQKDIDKTAELRSKNIANRKEVFVGTSQFPNSEEVLENIDFDYTFSKEPVQGYLGRALRLHRGPEEVEKLRLATDLSNKRPIVFNLTIGDKNFRKARAQFSSGFFGCAGFEIVDNIGFDNVDEGIKQAKEKKADIIVVCSSDDEYETIVTEVIKKADDKIVVVAGNPKCREVIEKEGAKHFIHIKSNLLEELEEYQELLGINPVK